MGSRTKIFFLAASVLAAAALSRAQESKPDFKISEITNKDGGLNVTSVRLEPLPVEVPNSPAARVELTSDITYGTQSGKAFVLPVSLDLMFRDPGVKFPRPPDVTVVLDGAQLKLRGVTENPVAGNITAGMVGDGIATSYSSPGVEMIGVLLPSKTFILLTKARSVELRIGELSVPLRENHLKAFQEMLKRSEGRARLDDRRRRE
jgi:hypothetical protein